MIPFSIDGQAVEGKEGGNVLQVALDAGIDIPHLCFSESVKPYGACRLCLVEVVKGGKSKMTTSCTYPATEGIQVLTQTEKVIRARRMIIELILAMCPGDKLIQDMAKEMGVKFGASSAQAVNDEIRILVPLYGGISYARLDSSENPAGLQWPCPSSDHPGTSILYGKDFPRGKGKFVPAEFEEEPGEADSSFALMTGPTMFHSGSLSTLSPGLARLQGESFVLVHPSDARNLGLADGQKVTLESRQGKITAKVSISGKAAPAVLFVPYHFGNGGNQLTGWDLRMTRVKLQKG